MSHMSLIGHGVDTELMVCIGHGVDSGLGIPENCGGEKPKSLFVDDCFVVVTVSAEKFGGDKSVDAE